MELKFVDIIERFFPKGQIWIFQTYFNYLIDGISIEFSRLYDKAKQSYDDINIIDSSVLAVEHSKDYLLTQGLYTRAELQRIIVEYLSKDFDIKEVIEDFANFIGTNIEFGSVVNPFMVGRSTIGNRLGDPLINNTRAILYVKFLDVDDVSNIAKVKDLVAYLNPPYLQVVYNDTNANINTPFITGRNTTGNPLGIIT